MVAQARQSKHQHKRHGHHQKRTSHFLKVYSPYLPLALIITVGILFTSYWQPRSGRGVLAYATIMSVSDLLADTNSQREANGVGDLNLNNQLDSAAQTKANDMVARDYWSHNTPDGNPPWVFITNAGYNYQSAGENLAYGFVTSSDTITGWMNSAEHRANMLNSGFVDVGFGFANSANFVGSGPETVVVAEYASPQGGAAPAAIAATPTPKTPVQSTPAPTPVPTPTPTPTPAASSTPKAVVATNKPASSQPATAVAEPSTQRVSRLQALTGASAPWVASMVSIVAAAALVALILKHGLALRKAMLKSERYVLHHMLFDVTVISLIGLCFIISRTAGFIR